MVFSSFEFLLWFLPFVLAIYYLTPYRHRNISLFIFSLIFYSYGTLQQPEYILLILLSVAVNYILGRCIDKSLNHRRFWLVIGLIYNFGVLAIFKYIDFFIENINRILAFLNIGYEVLPYTNLILPIGISFYTFQIVSYLIDVYWKKVPSEKNLITLGTYITMFPQLIAGPIVKFSEVREQLIPSRYILISGDTPLWLLDLEK